MAEGTNNRQFTANKVIRIPTTSLEGCQRGLLRQS